MMMMMMKNNKKVLNKDQIKKDLKKEIAKQQAKAYNKEYYAKNKKQIIAKMCEPVTAVVEMLSVVW